MTRDEADAAARQIVQEAPTSRHAIREWRHNFALEIGRCERCGHGVLSHLQLHEITNAHARQASQCNRSCILVVCAYCHAWLHRKGQHGKLIALAYLYHRRPGDFDLATIHRLRRDNWPELREVMIEVKRLVQETSE